MKTKYFATGMALALGMVLAVPAGATALFYNGFETDTAGWFSTARVPSGTDGIVSASGGNHAVPSTTGATFTRWGGYNYGAGDAVPTSFLEYWTSVDIYLDVDGAWPSNTRFDFSSAISNSAGSHMRDYIFNAGFYEAANNNFGTADGFVISASNNSQPGSAYAQNPGKDPISIENSGWYTFEHHFYNTGGTLGVDMSIYDSTDALVNTWTILSGDLISGTGGNRYGWFAFNEFGDELAFDNTSRTVVPEPASMTLLGLGLTGLAYRRFRKNRKA